MAWWAAVRFDLQPDSKDILRREVCPAIERLAARPGHPSPAKRPDRAITEGLDPKHRHLQHECLWVPLGLKRPPGHEPRVAIELVALFQEARNRLTGR